MPNTAKELYSQLRFAVGTALEGGGGALRPGRAWERMERVAVIRAVGVVFSESGAAEQKEAVRAGCGACCVIPARRYGVRDGGAAQNRRRPGGGSRIARLAADNRFRAERKFLTQTLEKIGGTATLKIMEKGEDDFLRQTGQKVKAGIARRESPSAVRMDGVLADLAGLRIHLRGRRGLEGIVRDEVEESSRARGKFRVAGVGSGLVAITPAGAIQPGGHLCAAMLWHGWLCAGRGRAGARRSRGGFGPGDYFAIVATDFEAFTQGTIRYRLNFVARGHQRSAVRGLAGRVYALCPEMLNDGRNVTWTMDICAEGRGREVELRPNLTPDPRFYYRREDIPAASHPPLAACMARLAGRARMKSSGTLFADRVWN